MGFLGMWYLSVLFCCCLICEFLFLRGVRVVRVIFLSCVWLLVVGNWLILVFFLLIRDVMDCVLVFMGIGVSVIFFGWELLMGIFIKVGWIIEGFVFV